MGSTPYVAMSKYGKTTAVALALMERYKGDTPKSFPLFALYSPEYRERRNLLMEQASGWLAGNCFNALVIAVA